MKDERFVSKNTGVGHEKTRAVKKAINKTKNKKFSKLGAIREALPA